MVRKCAIMFVQNKKEVAEVILVGTYHHQIDEKNRFRIPVKFKKEFSEVTPFVMKGTNRCLFLYSGAVAEKLFFNKFDESDFTDETKSREIRRFTANALWAESDAQGRIPLTDELIKYAGIKKNIVSVGVYNRVEIWSEENWKKYNESDGVEDKPETEEE